MLAVDPPADSGLSSGSLQYLARDAAERAWEMAHGARSSGLEQSLTADLARRAAAMLTGVGANSDLGEMAAAAGVPSRDLLTHALAWRDGGVEGPLRGARGVGIAPTPRC